MQRGGKFFLTSAVLALVACASDTGELSIRPIADPLAAAAKRGNPMIVEGRSLLALGNVGLALEAFRMAVREKPDSFEAIAGIAECYDRMGRYDVARQKYEEALAIAPNNGVLLNTFAASLERRGLRVEANALRAEAAEANASNVATQTEGLARVQVATAAPAAVTEPRAGPAAEPERPERSPLGSMPAKLADLRPSNTVTVALPKATATSSVTVKLPPPKARAAPPLARAQTRAEPKTVAAAPRARLERLSLGEVALLTTDAPIWKPQLVSQTRQSVTVRFVTLRPAIAVANIRVLNAARRRGIAALTRQVLLDRGWRKIAIGDAVEARESSIVLYPPHRQLIGRSLAAQFGFRSAVSSQTKELVVLVGRDASVGPARRTRA